MQFHGTADRWALAGASSVASLYTSATAPAGNPAVTLHAYGAGGRPPPSPTTSRARSSTRAKATPPGRGRSATAKSRRSAPTTSSSRDWVDFSKIAIPQADEQQRLLANLVTQMSADRLPLPRFWYFPRGEKAVVIMTGDDHGSSDGTASRFNQYLAQSPPGCSVADWQCVRATSYLYPSSGLTNAQAQAFQAAGFEVALHLSTGCSDFTPASLEQNWADQLPEFADAWPSVATPVTNRTHCIAWSDWASEATVERQHGVRLDTNYYYWPGAWVQDRPGMFTGSGMPMRFADTDGSLIDVYQAATQMTDESEINIAKHIAALLDGALGAQGYYGAFTANMHTDQYPHPGSDAIVAAAQARHVPVVSARQVLEWLDARNGSSFGGARVLRQPAELLDPAGRWCPRPAGDASGGRADRAAVGPVARRGARRDDRARRQGHRVRGLRRRRGQLRRHVRRRPRLPLPAAARRRPRPPRAPRRSRRRPTARPRESRSGRVRCAPRARARSCCA